MDSRDSSRATLASASYLELALRLGAEMDIVELLCILTSNAGAGLQTSPARGAFPRRSALGPSDPRHALLAYLVHSSKQEARRDSSVVAALEDIPFATPTMWLF